MTRGAHFVHIKEKINAHWLLAIYCLQHLCSWALRDIWLRYHCRRCYYLGTLSNNYKEQGTVRFIIERLYSNNWMWLIVLYSLNYNLSLENLYFVGWNNDRNFNISSRIMLLIRAITFTITLNILFGILCILEL